MLSKEERDFYNRHLLLENVGEKGQLKLKRSSVLVIGAGGLGCPVLSYLSGAGIGHIGIVDGDKVSTSNLHRQVLYGQGDIGRFKCDAAVKRLGDSNPFIRYSAYAMALTVSNALDIIDKFDVIVDATDNFPVRYLINDACITLGKPWVFASIDRFQGQLSVLNYNNGPSYRCLFPEPPNPESAPSCSEVGVLGILPGILGSLQANEVIKMILETGQVLSGKIMMIDVLRNMFYEVKISKNENSFKQVLDLRSGVSDDIYYHFCQSDILSGIDITIPEVLEKQKTGQQLQFVDIRNDQSTGVIDNALKAPFATFDLHISNIDKQAMVICYCDRGVDSRKAVEKLRSYGLSNTWSLAGGWQAWKSIIKEDKKNG